MRISIYPLYLNIELILSDDGRTLIGASGLASSYIGSIVVPDGIESIRKETFSGCINLTEIHLPASVVDIEQETFDECCSLTSIEVSKDNMHYMSEDGILYNRKRLSVVRKPIANAKLDFCVPDWVRRIDSCAFKNCKNLRKVVFPPLLTEIGDSAFFGCYSIEEVHLPSTVEKLGGWMFEECNNLKHFVFPMGCREIPNSMFSWCHSLEEVNIPSGVVRIGSYAFLGCSNLPRIDIPTGMTDIGYGAFRDCSRLSDFCLPSGLAEIKGETFNSCDSIKRIIIPEGVRRVGDSAIRLCESLEFLSLPSTLEKISFGGFGQCHKLRQIRCYSRNPDSISMGKSAFLDMDLSLCTLQVPIGMEQVYRNHFVFGHFGVIKGVL